MQSFEVSPTIKSIVEIGYDSFRELILLSKDFGETASNLLRHGITFNIESASPARIVLQP